MKVRLISSSCCASSNRAHISLKLKPYPTLPLLLLYSGVEAKSRNAMLSCIDEPIVYTSLYSVNFGDLYLGASYWLLVISSNTVDFAL